MQRKQKREIGVVGIEQVQPSKIEGVVAGNGGEESIQQVVLFFVELGVVHAEDFVEIGAGTIDFGQIEVVDHDGQGKLPKVIAVQLDFLDAFAEFADLGFLGIVEQDILGGGIVETDLTREGTLGVVKVTAFGLKDPAHFAGVFLLPLGNDVVVRLHFEQAFEDEREALRGRLLQSQNFHEVVVDAEISAVTLHGGFRQVIIEKGIVFELRELELVGVEVERSLENAKSLVFIENPDSRRNR